PRPPDPVPGGRSPHERGESLAIAAHRRGRGASLCRRAGAGGSRGREGAAGDGTVRAEDGPRFGPFPAPLTHLARSVRALVTGASGFIGRHVVASLAHRGAQVRAFDRRPPASGTFPDGVEFVRGDVLDAEAVRGAVRGCEAVF